MTKQNNEKRSTAECYAENLRKLQRDEAALSEERDLYLRMYFSSLISAEMSFDRASKSVLGGYKRLISVSESKSLSLDEKAILCRVLAERYPSIPAALDSVIAGVQSAQIVLWGVHSMSSAAYERFSSLFSSVERIDVESFSEVCDFVANGTGAFGIVPLENTTDGRLAAFYKMLDRNELRICAVCDVEDTETDVVTRLALVAKNLCAFDGDFLRCIEFSLVISDVQRRIELLGVAGKAGGTLTQLSMLPLSYRENASVDTIRLSFSKSSVYPFLMYLHLFCEDVNILGFYIQM